MRVLDIYRECEARPLSESSINVLAEYPTAVPMTAIMSGFKWLLEHRDFSSDYETLRKVMVNVFSDRIVKEMEANNGKYE